MDARLRDLQRSGRNDPATQATYRHELERLLVSGSPEFHGLIGDYIGAGGVLWLEDLTNQSQRLDAEGFPAEKDVPVFRLHGVPHNGERVTVTVRDLLDGEGSPWRDQLDWVERTRVRQDGSLGDYGRWMLPCAHGLSDVLDSLLAYQPQRPEQQDIRGRVLGLFKRRLTDDSWLVMKQRVRCEPQARWYRVQTLDGVFGVYVGESSIRRVEIVGQSREVREGQDDQALLALVGKNGGDTKRIYGTVTEFPTWFYRVNLRPQQQTEAALVLGVGSNGDGFGINDFGRAFGWSQSAYGLSQ